MRTTKGLDPEGLKRLIWVAKALTWFETFLRVRSKEGPIVPFHLNASQQILAHYVSERHYLGLPIELIQVKCRQHGSSTFWAGWITTCCELKPGFKAATIAHDERAAGTIFGKIKTFVRQLERAGWAKPYFVEEQRNSLVWDTESANFAGTIKTGDALGKGETLNAVHYTESANFTDKGTNAHKATASIQQSVANSRWRLVVHESTANGKDGFFWPLAEDARDPNSGSTMQLIFIPWLLTPEYRMTWGTYRRLLMESGGKDPGTFKRTEEECKLAERLATEEVTPANRYYRYRVKLTDKQLIWRRWAIKNLCNGDPEEFKRYYPSFYEEAFTASASSMFEPPVIDWYRKNSKPPKHRGVLQNGVFEEVKDGEVRIWQWPQRDVDYVLAADVGGDKAHSDPSCAYVIAKPTYEVVAMVHGHFEWDHFADTLIELGEFYFDALLVVENNYNPATAKRLFRKGYRNLYFYFDGEKSDARRGKTPGFNTNKGNRRTMLNRLRRACREMKLTCYDEHLWKEMESFVWVPKSGSENPDRDGEFRATGANHDDRIMALAIGVFQLPDYEDLPVFDHDEPFDPGPAYRDYLRFERELKEQERKSGPGYLLL